MTNLFIFKEFSQMFTFFLESFCTCETKWDICLYVINLQYLENQISNNKSNI